MIENVSINSYINEVTSLIDQLKSVKIEFTDEVYVIQLLKSLPDSLETMKTTVSNSISRKFSHPEINRIKYRTQINENDQFNWYHRQTISSRYEFRTKE